ncbi:MAG: transposase [Nanoarchaeota archaeon]|nr:transposase [Nanoarchaeota archaeon]
MWRKTVLNRLSISSSRYYYGYYVWSDRRRLNLLSITRYIARYVRHPPISNSRIIHYDGKKVAVKVKNESIETAIEMDVFRFIHLILQHIPPSQFKMVRYYGMYARNSKKQL